MDDKQPVGRPSKWDPKFTEEAYDYFNRDKFIIESREQVTASGRVAIVNEKIPNEFPSIAGLAVKFKVNKTTIYEWAKNNKDFSNALDYGRSIQESWLLDNSLTGRWNPGFAKFLMINNLNYKERVDNYNTDVLPPEIKYERDE